ncbi:MAG TPA: hemerythrin family protein [Anaeromyxobacteraceae bacterium]|nr:hemerythrin family protein [Anaeromyxobacteraceae bacterium]
MSRVQGPVLGMPELDAPHADLLSRADDLAAAARARRARSTTTLLDGLIEATALHFAYEEEWMDKTAYPDRVAHRTAHDLFLQDLHAASVEVRAAGVTPRVLDWACGRLQQWLRFHMEKNDRPLARHLERTRVRPAASTPAAIRS